MHIRQRSVLMQHIDIARYNIAKSMHGLTIAIVLHSQTLFCVWGGGKEKGLVNLVYHRRWPIPGFWRLNCTASGMT